MKHVRGAETGGWGGVLRMREASSHLLAPILYLLCCLFILTAESCFSLIAICTQTPLNTALLSTISPYTACWIWTALQLTLSPCLSLSHSLSLSLHSATLTLETDSFGFAGLHGVADFVELLVRGLNIPLDFAALIVPCWPSLVTLGM